MYVRVCVREQGTKERYKRRVRMAVVAMGCVFECDGGDIFMIQPTLNKRLCRANSPPTMKSIGSKNEPRPREGESKSKSEGVQVGKGE